MINKLLLWVFIFLVSFSCKDKPGVGNMERGSFDIVAESLNDTQSPFYIEKGNYPSNRSSLPVGIFDSGTGGLAVLDAIYLADIYNNTTHERGADGIPDFTREKFTYLADDANMPYGRYDAEGKADLLREHIIKDVNFLVDDRFFLHASDTVAQKGREPAKAIVIACNTATAYGLGTVREAVKEWGLGVRIMGIVDAGAGAVLEDVEDPAGELIGVLATEGTVASGGYPRAIKSKAGELFPGEEIAVVQQAGIGLAGAIDGDRNYIDPTAIAIRAGQEYKGPGIGNELYMLDTAFWDMYAFDTVGNALISDYDREGRLLALQLNSVENYIKYMVTHLYVNAMEDFKGKSISKVILGCTHYPYFAKEIREHFIYLDSLDGEDVNVVSNDIELLDPSMALASQLYEHLREKDLWANNSNKESEFYISVPNPLLKENVINEKGAFPYEYKYGREINTSLHFVKRLPFSDKWIKPAVKQRMQEDIPYTFDIIYSR